VLVDVLLVKIMIVQADRVSRSWIVFRHEMEAKLTSPAEIFRRKDLAISKW